jgi:hypothetical protein
MGISSHFWLKTRMDIAQSTFGAVLSGLLLVFSWHSARRTHRPALKLIRPAAL